MASLRETHCNHDASSFADYSPLLLKQKIDCSTQSKQILIKEAEVQCEKFEIEDTRINDQYEEAEG